MTADSEEDIKGLKAVGHVCALTLQKMMAHARPGMTTAELDAIGAEFMQSEGATSAPFSMYQFPGATCISINPVIAHGIPGDYVLKEGDLINIDVSAEMGGYFADTGASLAIGEASAAVEKMLEAAKSALHKALEAAQAGRPLNIIGSAIQKEAASHGFNVIHELTGHGIGKKLHEYPTDVFNFHNPRDRRMLTEGLVLAIEPFLTTGRGRIYEEKDGWSLRTIDRTMAAQFEHTVIITKNKPVILTV